MTAISKIPAHEQQQFLNDLNYLNTAEIKSFCKRHAIPYTIAIETADGRRKRTREDDRKGVMLARVRHFLLTGAVLAETVFPATAVSFDLVARGVAAEDKLHYGQYDKNNRAMISLLQELTGGQFKDGAVARILARKFWTSGAAPTFREYATEWLRMTREHTGPNAEWAFLSDRANKTAPPNWKRLRTRKASQVLKVLGQITAP